MKDILTDQGALLTRDNSALTKIESAQTTEVYLKLKFANPCIIIQFKYINQLDATTSQVYHLTFIYSSTCFGRPHAHHQKLNNCTSSLWFYRSSVVIAVLLVVVRLAGLTTTNSNAITMLQR
jgi:hypothetical protein